MAAAVVRPNADDNGGLDHPNADDNGGQDHPNADDNGGRDHPNADDNGHAPGLTDIAKNSPKAKVGRRVEASLRAKPWPKFRRIRDAEIACEGAIRRLTKIADTMVEPRPLAFHSGATWGKGRAQKNKSGYEPNDSEASGFRMCVIAENKDGSRFHRSRTEVYSDVASAEKGNYGCAFRSRLAATYFEGGINVAHSWVVAQIFPVPSEVDPLLEAQHLFFTEASATEFYRAAQGKKSVYRIMTEHSPVKPTYEDAKCLSSVFTPPRACSSVPYTIILG